ncbi:hypothetical protein CH63R_05431 [Colletotrichum higginsianum IMI 349063]|uniref:Uncharacterized protein n=1 Tax=Colletotrichum higginsianum (strain IMI 349063) TaxID=759273 RepID=A0A1B7YCE6_COLHI|nr:hypothetical protein CH63R_05431 [Colletotrichum higginsianum IMI 349063]OBR09739.1 hypothetical protein CH63R_05431 [Colletotrichum higginsianum IMI 349063]
MKWGDVPSDGTSMEHTEYSWGPIKVKRSILSRSLCPVNAGRGALGACASDAPPSRGGGSSRISRSGPSQGQRVSDWWLAMLGLVK